MAELERSLGYSTIIAISITSMVGTGIFMGPRIAAGISHNMSLLAWLILSLMTLYVSFCFAELSSMFPELGGVYEFTKRTYGRFISFMIGWITWLVGSITTSVVIVTALGYLVPDGYRLSFLPDMSTVLLKILLAIVLILILNYVAFRGVEASGKLLVLFAMITLGILVAVIVPGLWHADPGNLVPFLMEDTLLDNGLLVLVTLFFIIETYFGWESATFLAEETKNPERVIPISLIISSAVVALIGGAYAYAILGNIHWNVLQSLPIPFYNLSSLFYPPYARAVFAAGVFITLIGSAAAGIVSSPRLLLALARDKLFINTFADIHERHKTPYKAILFQTVISILVVIIGFGEYEVLLSMLVPLALIMYIFVLLAVPILRHRLPDARRFIRTPFGRIGPVLVSTLFIGVIIAWLWTDNTALPLFKLMLSFVFFGVPIYLLLMFYYDPDVIVKLNDIFAYFTLAFERVLIPRRIDHAIFQHTGNLAGKTVLEFGCGVGTFTKELAAAVGPTGVVYATDISYTQVKIANRRIAKRGHINVHFVHDVHQVNRVHHSIPKVDCIVSIAMLGYLQDIHKVLTELHDLLPEGGRIFFVDYVDLFKVIPNVSWISHEDELIRLFRDSGFSVKVEKIRGRMWNYLFIMGIKSSQDVPFI
jgi:amino acid transporter/phospholipid N-methyltransferase